MHPVEVDDSSRSHDVHRVGIEDSAGKNVEAELALVIDDCMAGIVAALEADDQFRI